MFILMGAAIASTRAGADLYEALDRWLTKIPGGLVVPILAMGIIIYFLSNLGKVEAIAAGILIGNLSLIYVLIKVYKNKLK